MAAVDCGGGRRRRFAVACGVLSSCIKAQAAAGKMASCYYPASSSSAAATTMLLMPGADVVPDVREEEEEDQDARRAPVGQLAIVYGGRVLVFDGCRAQSAAELVRAAAARGAWQEADARRGGGRAELPVARKASLQRFIDKRRGRLAAAAAPYSPRPSRSALAARAWLAMGTPGSGCAAR
ncbi:protein TIFY 11e-like [Oryza brachyantha]|uniref:protein TIFY 11e-like n=1 Tax=Oryza brachyantha TaxID=4533 RepID=UPI001ADA64B5|nr:protein TIFY 11e-like [Oryza brachyantha]